MALRTNLSFPLLLCFVVWISYVEAKPQAAHTAAVAAVEESEKNNSARGKIISGSVKKALSGPPPAVVIPPVEPHTETNNDKVIVISERTLAELQKIQAQKNATAVTPNEIANIFHAKDDVEFSDGFKTGFYLVFGITTGALMFLVVKVYRMRLTRAERKYGVQGDRSTQELTPLPIAIEDANSDEEDQTLFEINRQNIRIF